MTKLILTLFLLAALPLRGDLAEVKERGVLRHIGVYHSNFVTEGNIGFDTELIKLFAQYLGVEYKHIPSEWSTIIPDLSGKIVKVSGNNITITGTTEIKGDIAANGMAILQWRKKIINFSSPLLPTKMVLIAAAQSKLRPIKPTGNMISDIISVQDAILGSTIIGIKDSATDPHLYALETGGGKVIGVEALHSDMAPAVIGGHCDFAILDFGDALRTMQNYPGKIKIIGPISSILEIGCAFHKESTELLNAFNTFIEKGKQNGSYYQLVKKYFPGITGVFPDFFNKNILTESHAP